MLADEAAVRAAKEAATMEWRRLLRRIEGDMVAGGGTAGGSPMFDMRRLAFITLLDAADELIE